MHWNAASSTASGSPTKVITVLFVSKPGSTSSTFILSDEFLMASTTALMTCLFLPSDIFGTHSIIFIFTT